MLNKLIAKLIGYELAEDGLEKAREQDRENLKRTLLAHNSRQERLIKAVFTGKHE